MSVRNGASVSSDTRGIGNAGDLTITTELLQVVDGASINSSTRATGNAGKLTVNAQKIEIDREIPRTSNSAPIPTGLFAQVEETGTGSAGVINIKTKTLSVGNGGKVQAATFGKGNGGGNIFIKADEITLFETPGINPSQLTNINAGVGFDNDRNIDSAGNPVLAQSQGGNLTIETRRLILRNRSAISSDTRGIGNAGKVSIMATELVEITGKNARLSVEVTTPNAVGNGGELTLKTPKLVIKDEGYISTSSAGKGVAGKLNINAKTIELQNGARITGTTTSGQGGNIELNVSDYILMRQNSQISTTAGTAQQGGDGGNITIDSPVIVATPINGNSDITANAYTGKGGNITIKSNGLIGIQPRLKGQDSLFTNDITASSEFNPGIIKIGTPVRDPGKDTTELPAAPTDASNQISQVCSAAYSKNTLTVAGRGGMPENAYEPLNSDVVWQDARAAKGASSVTQVQNNHQQLPPAALGWVFDGKGKVKLIAATQRQPAEVKIVCPQ